MEAKGFLIRDRRPAPRLRCKTALREDCPQALSSRSHHLRIAALSPVSVTFIPRCTPSVILSGTSRACRDDSRRHPRSCSAR
jgi:hypothetical protein